MEQAEMPGGIEESAERESELMKVRRSKLQRMIEDGAEPFKPLYRSPGEIVLSGILHERFADLEPGSGSGKTGSVAKAHGPARARKSRFRRPFRFKREDPVDTAAGPPGRRGLQGVPGSRHWGLGWGVGG